jgi:phage anti-repressor protein
MLTILNHRGHLGVSARHLYKALNHEGNFYSWINRHLVDAVKERDYHELSQMSTTKYARRTGDYCLHLPLASAICRRTRCFMEPGKGKRLAEYLHDYTVATPVVKVPAKSNTITPTPIKMSTKLTTNKLSLLTHEGYQGVSFRKLYDALRVGKTTPVTGFPSWFDKCRRSLTENVDYVMLQTYEINEATGYIQKGTGDFLVTIPTALSLCARSTSFPARNQVIGALNQLTELAVDTQVDTTSFIEPELKSESVASNEPNALPKLASDVTSEHVTYSTTPLTDADRIVDLALVIQELKSQEMMLITEQQELSTRLDKIREKLTDAKANLLITIG